MTIRLKTITMLAGILMLTATSSWAIAPYIYAAFDKPEIGSGGIGLMITDDIAVDISLYHEKNKTTATESKYYYGDIFFGSWGLGYEYDSSDPSIEAIKKTLVMYSVSQPINDKLSVGICTTLFSSSTGGESATRILPEIEATISMPLPFKF